MNIMDVMKIASDPKTFVFLEDAKKFIVNWTQFMNFVRSEQKSIQMQLESIDNKMTMLLSQTAVTAEIHGDVAAMSSHDPRNAVAIALMERTENANDSRSASAE